jgi:hypothetical protein
LPRHVDREAIFHPEFRQDLRYWVETDRKTALRTLELIEAVLRDPFAGLGKPARVSKIRAGRMLVSPHYSGTPACVLRERIAD